MTAIIQRNEDVVAVHGLAIDVLPLFVETMIADSENEDPYNPYVVWRTAPDSALGRKPIIQFFRFKFPMNVRADVINRINRILTDIGYRRDGFTAEDDFLSTLNMTLESVLAGTSDNEVIYDPFLRRIVTLQRVYNELGNSVMVTLTAFNVKAKQELITPVFVPLLTPTP